MREVLQERLVAIEHVGSTSVSGLPAKPIIDIAAATASLVGFQGADPQLRDLEYQTEAFGAPNRLFYMKRGASGTRMHATEV